MNRLLRLTMGLALLQLIMACSGDDNNSDDNTGELLPSEKTFVLFNPGLKQLPLPSDIQFASEPLADGTMSAGPANGNPVIAGIDALDGNSVLAPIDISFSDSLDSGQVFDARNFVVVGESILPNPNQNIFLLPLAFPSGDGLLQAKYDLDGDGIKDSLEIPTFAEAITYQGAAAALDTATLIALATPTARAELISLDGGVDNTVRITPIKPLLPRTKYLVVITGDILDVNGNAVFRNSAYESIRDPDFNLAGVNPALVPLGPVVRGWEQLASGYFGFQQTVFDTVGTGTAPVYDDILMTLSLTTAGTTDALTHLMAPELFLESNLRTGFKQQAIIKLVTGVYNLSADNSALSDPIEIGVNTTLNVLLTAPMLSETQANPLYSESIAGAIAAGAGYSVLAADASAAYLMQRAVTEAELSVRDAGSAISLTAAGLTQALLAGGIELPIPSARTTRFYQVDDAATINAALRAPAKVYQGEISLPMYQALPEEDGAEIVTARWQADEVFMGGIVAAQTPPGTDVPPPPYLPSDKTTSRYPFPVKQAMVTIPVLAVTPDETVLGALGYAMPDAGWPVIIYQHGITTDRSAVLPMANAMAFACIARDAEGTPTGLSGLPCYATVAIDQPLHGVSPSGSTVPGLLSVNDPDNASAALASDGITERHYNFTADATNSPVAMDYAGDVGASGSLFINLTNFENTRDTLRQMPLDLANLNASLNSMDLKGDGSADDFDTSNVYFIGHSLGAIEGIPFVAVNNDSRVQSSAFNDLPRVKAAAFLNVGGGIPKLLANSTSRAPLIMQGLAAASDALTQGKSGLETYFNVFQGVIDSVDPMNFAASLSDQNSSTGVLITSAVGDGGAWEPDTVIPNAADTLWGANNGPLVVSLSNGFNIGGFAAPLAGTEPLVAQFGATSSSNADSSDGDAAVLVSRFSAGSHGTPISADSPEAFSELVTQILVLFANDGIVDGSIVSNPSVIAD
ncbi:MAG: hypothetical protein ACI93R_000632 [Flavobacteriales bacterium]|jgi:hypothetical protein